MIFRTCLKQILLFLLLLLSLIFLSPGKLTADESLDKRVKKFLENHRYEWEDMNVPSSDGKILYDLIIKNKYKKALEIGTSTGHSGVWIAWALSKTGGKLITIDIDERRHKTALENFKQAGVSEYMDGLGFE